MIHGVINVYKEKGYTSHDVVAKLRGILKQKKIGHTGTLDPDAQGVLPVCLGRATKVCDLLTNKNKTYRAVLLLGTVTDTQDTSGKVLDQREVTVTEDEVRSVLQSFVGSYDQIPPMYSALKVNGRKLYELAREGKEVERKPRSVTIFQIEVESICLPRVEMTVHCSKGTYIRTLCHDIGAKLGCGGCMEELLRTRVGPFDVEDSLALSEIERRAREGSLEEIVTAVDQLFAEYRAVTARQTCQKLLENGNPFLLGSQIETIDFKDQEQVRVYDERRTFYGIYRFEKERNGFWPVKLFFER
ncbi:MAG: tRNA pseudouridine(55) synthase TruB [Lachnospiraceae bacterium]|nr:tRNA pseudouridine(55) synthase TruB [Lachnospiraceae bacterium]